MATLSAAQARDLARLYHELATTLGRYRFDNWDDLTKARRASIEAIERSLLSASSDFTVIAINLALDDVDPVLKRIKRVTKRMTAAVKKLKRTDKVIRMAEAAVKLTGAILSGAPSAIASALDEAIRASK
ncbi:MAG: hypothetical protein JSW50_08660 [Candidatus Latescibacterota bacterium]|nr:MAG: hypothetical protein JSW50_08660 [Candidatus Latescibacterota bacterium]